MKKLTVFLFMLIVLVNQPMLVGQTHDETSAVVPELRAFHEVIFKLWHDAWPNKNIGLMNELIPEIEIHAGKVQKAELPGILRDKKPKWDENIKSLDAIVTEYKSAVTANDTQKSLDAAEKLHAQYEKLVRTIRPVLKEIDEFHQALYPLYHYYMPEDNREKIRASVKELQEKMKVLNEAKLPERLAAKGKSFNMKRKDLNKSVKYVAKVVQSIDDAKTIKDAIEEMHTKYQALEKVFN